MMARTGLIGWARIGVAVALLLQGPWCLSAELVRHTVDADGHPLAVWEKSAAGATEAILLVHGRTWSALPDFDLRVDGEDLSLMDGLVEYQEERALAAPSEDRSASPESGMFSVESFPSAVATVYGLLAQDEVAHRAFARLSVSARRPPSRTVERTVRLASALTPPAASASARSAGTSSPGTTTSPITRLQTLPSGPSASC